MRSVQILGMMIEEALDQDDALMALLLEISTDEWEQIAKVLQGTKSP